jgi:plasmid maintenance system antidote protein VapI
MKPMEISQNELARALRVPPRRINEIVHGSGITWILTAVQAFRDVGKIWLLQDDYDLMWQKILK